MNPYPRSYPVIFFFVFVLIGCSKPTLRINLSSLTEDGGLMYYEGQTFSGTAFEMWDAATIKTEIDFLSGQRFRRVHFFHIFGSHFRTSNLCRRKHYRLVFEVLSEWKPQRTGSENY